MNLIHYLTNISTLRTMISGFWHCHCASRFHPIIGTLKAPHQAMQTLSSNQNFWMSSMVEHSCPALSRSHQVAGADSQESLSAHWQSHTAQATTELSGQTSSVAPPPEVPHQNPLCSAQRGAVAGRDPLKPREVKRKTDKVASTTPQSFVKEKEVCLSLLSRLYA
jgi:hypothetical protein